MSDFSSLDIYRSILRPILFSGLNLDPEWLHQQTLASLEWLDTRSPLALRTLLLDQLTGLYDYKSDRLSQTCFGCQFANPLGLSAGFDKNGAQWLYRNPLAIEFHERVAFRLQDQINFGKFFVIMCFGVGLNINVMHRRQRVVR